MWNRCLLKVVRWQAGERLDRYRTMCVRGLRISAMEMQIVPAERCVASAWLPACLPQCLSACGSFQ